MYCKSIIVRNVFKTICAVPLIGSQARWYVMECQFFLHILKFPLPWAGKSDLYLFQPFKRLPS